MNLLIRKYKNFPRLGFRSYQYNLISKENKLNFDDISEEGDIIVKYLLSISQQLSGDQGENIATNLSNFTAILRDKLLERDFSREEAIAIICRLQHLKT